MSEHSVEHHHHHAPGAGQGRGLLDGVRSVKYNYGADEEGGQDRIEDAYVLHQVESHRLVLGRFINGTFQLINNGNPVPERAVADYEGKTGGVTWHNATGTDAA